MATDPNRVKEIFLGAVEQADETARIAYLDHACGGDAGLRERVEALLRSHDPAGSFLGTPAAVVPDPNPDGTMALDAADPDGGSPSPDADDASDGLPFLTPPGRPDSLGRIGHYEVLEVLGKGGFGIVFRAFDEQLQRVVAIKVLSPQLAATSPPRKRFLREARSAAKVRHENVVQVYAVEEQPLPYLVMEFIPGETLQQRLHRTGPLETPEVLRIGRQIAEGLAAAHATGLIHRDIKPGNILIEAGPNQHVKITDFGLARAADDASLTQSGTIAGTPMFMAPEQAHGDTLDYRADLFSLGSVLYMMASGRPPFRANNTLAVLKRVAEDTPRPISEIIPEVPTWLCALIARLHAKKPEDRIGTAREVADLLVRGLEVLQRAANFPSLPAAAPAAVAKVPREARASDGTVELSRPAPAVRPRFHSRRWAAAAAVMLLALLGGFGFTEATGVTNVRGTVIRLFSPEGTLVVEVDDPGVSVQIEGSDLVITGAGAREIRLKPGSYSVEARKDGKIVSRELVSVARNGRQVLRISQEPADARTADAGGKGSDRNPTLDPKQEQLAASYQTWAKAIAILPLDKQCESLAAKLNERLPRFEDALVPAIAAMPCERQLALMVVWLKHCNPGFDGKVTHKVENGVVTNLDVTSPLAQDLMPLRALTELRTLMCRAAVGYDLKADINAPVLRSLGSLEQINGKPVAEFWKDAASRQAEFKEWLEAVPALTPEQQVAVVAGKLKERNPGFDGLPEHKIEGGLVTELSLANVMDLSPVRALVGLKAFSYGGPLSDLSPLKGMKLSSLTLNSPHLRDLSPLKGMPLTALNLAGCTQIQDLGPLKGMPLTSLDIGGWVGQSSGVQDLSPLKGMPLTALNLRCNPVQNLSPLKGMPLTSLELGLTAVRDLTPLRGMKLTTLHLHNCTELWDLAPLKDMPLTTLNLGGWMGTPVRDLTPLKGMQLKSLSIEATGVTDLTPLQALQPDWNLSLTPKNITQGLNVLRGMMSLKSIGLVTPSLGGYQLLPAAEFWRRYDKGEFKK